MSKFTCALAVGVLVLMAAVGRADDLGGGGTVIQITSGPGAPDHPSLCQVSDGTYLAVFNDTNAEGGGRDVYIAASPDGLVWGTPRRVTYLGDVGGPSILQDNNGRCWIAFDRSNGGMYDIGLTYSEKHGQKTIRQQDVRRAWNSAKDLKKSHLLRKLTDHHRLLYELIAKNQGILSGDLWRLYLRTCSSRQVKPIAVRTYSDYCNKLVETGIVRAKRAAIQGKVREFSAGD